MIGRILVALHDREDPGTCLEKAAQLEHYSGAVVDVVQSCWDAISDEPAEHFPQEEIDSIATRLKATELRNLSATLAAYRSRVADLRVDVLWAKHHATAVARHAIETGADLIVAPRHASPQLLLPEALKLASQAHVPLLLASGSTWGAHPNLVASVDAGNPAHEVLNHKISEFAEQLAQLLGGELHLASIDCTSTSSAIPAETIQAFRDRALRARTEALQQLANDLSAPCAGQHVVSDDIVPGLRSVVREERAALLVIGTAARTGLHRLFVGNTAEAVMRHLVDTDILLIPSPHR